MNDDKWILDSLLNNVTRSREFLDYYGGFNKKINRVCSELKSIERTLSILIKEWDGEDESRN